LFELIHRSYDNLRPFVKIKKYNKVLKFGQKLLGVNNEDKKSHNIVVNYNENTSRTLCPTLQSKTMITHQSIASIESNLISNDFNIKLIDALVKHEYLIKNLSVPKYFLWRRVLKTMSRTDSSLENSSPNYCKQKFGYIVTQLVSIINFSPVYEEVILKSPLFVKLMAIPFQRLVSEEDYKKLSQFIVDEPDHYSQESNYDCSTSDNSEKVTPTKTFGFKCRKFKSYKIEYYSVMLQIIDEVFESKPKERITNKEFSEKWIVVSNKLKDMGHKFKICTPDGCTNSFLNIVSVYREVFIFYS